MAKRGIALNQNNDIFINPATRSLGIVVDTQTVAQDVSTRLQVVKGEYLLNKNYGIDYLTLFSERNNLVALENALKRQITNTDGVVDLEQFRFSTVGDRKLNVSFSCLTVYSESITLEGIQIG